MGGQKHRIIKQCAYALLIILASVVQNTRGLPTTLMGGRLDMLPVLVASIALFEGPYTGGALGFFAGLLLAIHSPMVEGLSALYLGLFGIGFGILGSGWLRRVCPAALLGGLCCIALQGLVRYVFYSRMVYGLALADVWQPLLGGLLLAVLPGIGAFYLVRGLHRRFSEE